jgi:hypothetical protein
MSFASSTPAAYYPGSNPDVPVPDKLTTTLVRSHSNHEANLIDVPVTPLVPTSEQSADRQVRLDILSDEMLALDVVPSRPPWLSRLTYLTFVGCLMYMIFGGVQAILFELERQKIEQVIVWAVFSVLPLIILIGTLIYPFFKAGPLLYRFDRIARLMTIQRCYGFNKKPRLIATYALDDLVVLQLLNRYYNAIQHGIEANSIRKQRYEMNLVFRNTVPPRVNLAAHADWVWMRQAGSRLAEFLDIPLLDQLCKT